MAGAENAHQFVHRVSIRRQDRNTTQALRDLSCRTCIETLSCCHHDEDVMPFAESVDGVADGGQIMCVFTVSFRAGVVKVRPSVMARLVRPGSFKGNRLTDGRAHWPLEWINWANDENWLLTIPAVVAK